MTAKVGLRAAAADDYAFALAIYVETIKPYTVAYMEWAATNKAVVLGVLKNNPARRLYERLGFAVASETDTKFMMRREARPSSRL